MLNFNYLCLCVVWDYIYGRKISKTLLLLQVASKLFQTVI